ncbi:hypothetical protein ACHAC9_22985 [Massilia sp. CMS3.1]|uniref:hypothetical protein n=1 Tax=Massilia sp. CMS3.1 TaxID=3373083 RepID=UPI003EE52C25
MNNALKDRQMDRRADPILATLIDVAIAYRENLGCRVAQAFLHETGVPPALAMRVLAGSARMRATVPRRWSARAVHDLTPDGV